MARRQRALSSTGALIDVDPRPSPKEKKKKKEEDVDELFFMETRVPRPQETRVAPFLDPSPDPPPAEGDAQALNYDPNRTAFSYQAAMFADVLRDRFSDKIYGRTPRRILRVDEPDGPSTAGGRLARQAISLIPRKGVAQTLVCGWMDVSTKESILRSYQSLAARQQARYGTELDLPEAEYDRFLDELVSALMTGGIRVRVLLPEPKEAAPAGTEAQAPRGLSVSLWLTVILWGLAFVLGLFAERATHWSERLLSLMPALGLK